MKFTGELREGRLVQRDNRFLARVALPEGEVAAHVANSGRLGELLFPGNRVMLQAAPGARRTAYTLVLAWAGKEWACVVSAWANALTREAAVLGLLPPLAAYPAWRAEVPWGESRIDFLLSGAELPPCLVEVKGVTLVSGEAQARFPDAPTQRAARHLRELARAAACGHRAAVVFAVQRPDATSVTPNRATDPTFAAALEGAAQAGVQVLAFTCRCSPAGIFPDRAIPVMLSEE